MYLFIRKNNKVTGPFPIKQLQQAMLLGRLSLQDEVSKDRQEWVSVGQFPELVPEVLQADVADPQAKERLDAARRWADERRSERRHTPGTAERAGSGRRGPEDALILEHRQLREENLSHTKNQRDRWVGAALLVVLILGGAGYAGFRFIPARVSGAQCDAAPASQVNWNSCNLVGMQAIKANLTKASLNGTNLLNANLFGVNFSEADISYANFTQANLSFAEMQRVQAKGANFTQSDLSNANLSDADLSYANFKQAKMQNVVLTHAKLDQAIWIDGKVCAPGSVGQCFNK